MNFRSIAACSFAGLLTLSTLATLACSASGESEPSEETEGALGRAGAVPKDKWVGPQPGTLDNTIDKDLVLKAWNKTREDFYITPAGASHPPGLKAKPASPLDAEPGQCLAACPAWWGDLVCHFYCWYPSYQPTNPNIRACFSGAARGTTRTESLGEAGTSAPRQLFYPEVYDYCIYQDGDFVTNSRVVPYDQTVIDKNKKLSLSPGAPNPAGGAPLNPMPGALEYVKKNQDEAFRYVMYTWYHPNTFSYVKQQEVIDEFYRGAGLTRPVRPTDATKTATGNPSLTPHPKHDAVRDWMKAYATAHAR